jgi:hypothetical protein
MSTGSFDGAISSPPFKGQSADGGWQLLGKYAEQGRLTVKQADGDPSRSYLSWSKDRDTSYGKTPGQLANLPEGSFDGAVSSPPFNQNKNNAVHGETKGFHSHDENESRNRMKRDYILADSPANLGNMPINTFEASVSSPPFENSMDSEKNGIDWEKTKKDYPGRVMHKERIALAEKHHTERRYGNEDGQLGIESGDDFWSASRLIVEQVYMALAPGGHAVWVCKNFIKDKKEVQFTDQWRQLCEAVGFVTLHEHHALLSRHRGTSITLDGERIKHVTSSKSFFRRLCEAKGSPPIDFESVLCMGKPIRIILPEPD